MLGVHPLPPGLNKYRFPGGNQVPGPKASSKAINLLGFDFHLVSCPLCTRYKHKPSHRSIHQSRSLKEARECPGRSCCSRNQEKPRAQAGQACKYHVYFAEYSTALGSAFQLNPHLNLQIKPPRPGQAQQGWPSGGGDLGSILCCFFCF